MTEKVITHKGGTVTTSAPYIASATSSDWRGTVIASGPCSAAMATGESGAAFASGPHGAAFSTGYRGKAKASLGCSLHLDERDADLKIVATYSGIAGTGRIKPDTYYTLINGKLVDCYSLIDF